MKKISKIEKINPMNLIKIFILIILIQITTAQFPWQFKDFSDLSDIVPFKYNSDALVRRVAEIIKEYEDEYPEFFYELSLRTEFIHYMCKITDRLINLYTDNLIPFLLSEPNIENEVSITFLNLSISILVPLYIIAILLTTLYLLFISGSPKGRAKAKATFVKLIIGFGIIMLTLPIFQLLLEISHIFSSMILSLLKPEVEIFKFPISFFMSYFVITTFFRPIFGSFFLLISLILPFAVLFVFSIRFFFILIATIFFPFTVLLYSFSPTKRIGETALKITLLWIFLPILNASIIGITSISFLISPLIPLKVFIRTAGFLLLTFSPIICAKLLDFLTNSRLARVIKYQTRRKLSSFIGE